MLTDIINELKETKAELYAGVTDIQKQIDTLNDKLRALESKKEKLDSKIEKKTITSHLSIFSQIIEAIQTYQKHNMIIVNDDFLSQLNTIMNSKHIKDNWKEPIKMFQNKVYTVVHVFKNQVGENTSHGRSYDIDWDSDDDSDIACNGRIKINDILTSSLISSPNFWTGSEITDCEEHGSYRHIRTAYVKSLLICETDKALPGYNKKHYMEPDVDFPKYSSTWKKTYPVWTPASGFQRHPSDENDDDDDDEE